MNWSVLSQVLDDIASFFKKRTPVEVYIPVIAFLGAWLLTFIAAFGIAAPLAYWRQLDADLKILLVAASVFAILFLAFLVSYLRTLILQIYQGMWPQILNVPPVRWLTELGRKNHLSRWRGLVEEIERHRDAKKELEAIQKLLAGEETEEVIFRTKRDLPPYHRIRPDEDLELQKDQDISDWLLDCYTLTHLKKGQHIEQSQVRAEPWPGYLRERVAVPVPLLPHNALGGTDSVQGGDLVHVTLMPKPNSTKTGVHTYYNLLVLDAKPASETLVAESGDGVKRDLAVLVVALEARNQNEFLSMMRDSAATATRSSDRSLVNRVPITLPSAARENFSVVWPLDGVSVGDVVSVELVRKGGKASISFGECFVYEVDNKDRTLTVAVPVDRMHEYERQYAEASDMSCMTVKHAEWKVPVLKVDVEEGQILIADSLDEVTKRVTELPGGDVVLDMDKVLNRRAREKLSAEDFVRRRQIEAVEWVDGSLDHTYRPVTVRVTNAKGVRKGHIVEVSDDDAHCYVLKIVSDTELELLVPPESTLPPEESGRERSNNIFAVTPVTKRVPVLRQGVKAVELITRDNTIEKTMNAGELPVGTISNRGRMVWRRAKQALEANKTVLDSQLERPIQCIDTKRAGFTDAQKRKREEFENEFKELEHRLQIEESNMDRSTSAISGSVWPKPEFGDFLGLVRDAQGLYNRLEDYENEHPGAVLDLLHRISSQELGEPTDFEERLENLGRNWEDALVRRSELIMNRMRLYYPTRYEEQFMPTALGNILKSAELYPYTTYHIRADLILPRLEQVASDAFAMVMQSKSTLDMLLLVSFLSLLFWPGASAVLYFAKANPWAFAICFFGAPILACLCYKASIQSALSYGENLKTLFDLHRWKLLKAFNFDLPDGKLSLEEEKKVWREINGLFEGMDEPLKDYKYTLS